MRFSTGWLAEYVDLPGEVGELVERLTGAGFNVELIEEVAGDTVLDVDVTTNRVDAMCHLGLAREVAALWGRPLRRPGAELPPPEPSAARPADLVTLEAPELCRRYVGRVVRGVEVGPSPEWLRRRLEALGLRPINNVVDVTNYVLWEMGQPLHAFDLTTLDQERIVVRTAAPGEVLVTLDGVERSLTPEMLVIADAQRPVALAGVMGGAATEVTAATRDLLLESAWFDPTTVRRAARGLGLHTDASHRFERGADPEICRAAADRAAALLLEIGGGELGEMADVRGEPLEEPASIELDLSRVEAFAGTALEDAEVISGLVALGFRIEERGERVFVVEVPSWRRFDVLEEADLYEEVLRLHGFEAIPATLPAIAGLDAPEPEGHRLRRRLAQHLAASGFAEAIDYAFYGAADDHRFAPVSVPGPALKLDNPLSERYALMRRSLLPGLLESADFNRRRNLSAVRLFELGHVFWGREGGEPEEAERLALVCGGRLGAPWERASELDLWDLKGVVESLAEGVGFDMRARPAEIRGLVPGVAAELVIDAGGGFRVVGHLGQVEEEAEGFPLFAAEIDTGAFLPLALPAAVTLPSRYPGISVDLTLTHSLDHLWEELEATIREAGVADLQSFALKDRYQGPGVPEGAVNTTIAFHYRAADRSLTQEEVNERHRALARELEQRFGWGG
jgi:phenylalanyl-tRNA synthetase beta chain